MALSSLRPYFRTHLVALGYTEWKDGFNSENIPSTGLHMSFFIAPGSGTTRKFNQADIEMEVPISLEMRFKGYRNAQDAVDLAYEQAESIIDRVCKASNRIGTAIKNVYPDGFSVERLDNTNDNASILVMNFTSLVILAPDDT